MDIISKIMDIDCYLQSINASRSSSMNGDAIRRVELKRNVSHKISVPKRKSDNFSFLITDRITFNPDKGPFKIEIVLGAKIILSFIETEKLSLLRFGTLILWDT